MFGGYAVRRFWLAGAAALSLACGAPALAAKPPAPVDATAGLSRQDGLVPVYVDAAKGRVLVALPAPDKAGVAGRYLYVSALKTGLGSAPIGLDRARLGDTQVLAFQRVGPRVVAEFENPRFRASDAPDDETAAAREAFATSVVWSGKIEGTTADGRLVVDLSSFLTRDVMGIADALKQGGEAGFKLAADLSMPDPASVKVFPENVEFEALQTFASDTPGAEVRNIAPDPRQVTFVVRHSLVKLPEPGFQPRWFDPRSGGFDGVVLDYAAPLDKDIVQRLARRFRLEKTDPSAAVSTVKKPIVFYVDRAAPEPVRTALVEGARWWADAFEAAGYKDAYRVEVMPEGADPLVMDYPAPRVKLTGGQIDLSDAYGVGIGAWDKFTVDWLYGDGDPAAKADKAARTMRYITDVDARGVGTGQPHAAIWDDGADPVAELNRMLQVRRVAIEQFGDKALRPGEAAQALKRKYVPIYLLHRYQLEAAAKVLGGVDFSYAVKGDPKAVAAMAPAAGQRAALTALLAAMAPANLDTPEALIPLLSSGQSGDTDRQYDMEVFDGAGGPVFDALNAADVGAGLVLDALLAPPRLARLVEQSRRDPGQPGVGEVVDKLLGQAFAPANGRLAEVARRVQTRTVLELAATTRRPDVSPAAKAEISLRLTELAAKLKAQPGAGSDRAHRLTLASLLEDKEDLIRVLAQPKRRPEAPPGMPIGSDED